MGLEKRGNCQAGAHVEVWKKLPPSMSEPATQGLTTCLLTHPPPSTSRSLHCPYCFFVHFSLTSRSVLNQLRSFALPCHSETGPLTSFLVIVRQRATMVLVHKLKQMEQLDIEQFRQDEDEEENYSEVSVPSIR